MNRYIAIQISRFCVVKLRKQRLLLRAVYHALTMNILVSGSDSTAIDLNRRHPRTMQS